MKPATDPHADYKALVQRGYDQCSAAYTGARSPEPPAVLELLNDRLAEGARVLDLGCGGGIPVAKSLAERYEVTGVDFSGAQIRAARLNVPGATLHHCDVMEFTAPERSFDAVTAFYMLFHLPRTEQLELVTRISGWLKPGGLFLGTVSDVDEAPYTEDDFYGVTMYWTNFSLARYEAIFKERGFRVRQVGALGQGFSESAEQQEHHPVLLAERIR